MGAFHIVSTPALSLRAIKTKFYDLLCRVEAKKAAIKCRWIAEDKRNYFVFTGLKLAFHLLYNLNLFIFVVSFEACGSKTGKMRKKKHKKKISSVNSFFVSLKIFVTFQKLKKVQEVRISNFLKNEILKITSYLSYCKSFTLKLVSCRIYCVLKISGSSLESWSRKFSWK